MKRLESIEIVEDRTAGSRCDEGFLTLRRLIVRNRYADGTTSDDYPCDIVSRPHSDAVAICLYRVRNRREVKVVLKESPRVPVFLREDPVPHKAIVELAAGLIEPGDDPVVRAASEAAEESGHQVARDLVDGMGGATFASPGTSNEKVHFCAAPVESLEAAPARGDGTTMEEATRAVVFDLREAIRMCRDGRIPDMKTEVGLLRLAERIGYLPQLDRFIHELPEPLREAYDRLGVEEA